MNQTVVEMYLEPLIKDNFIINSELKQCAENGSFEDTIPLIVANDITEDGIKMFPNFSNHCHGKASNVILHTLNPMTMLKINTYIKHKIHRIMYVVQATPLTGLIIGTTKKQLHATDVAIFDGTEKISLFNMSRDYSFVLIFDENQMVNEHGSLK